ncbi:spore germination protein [Fredinandcohnia sp. QZ13]|uniref:spore germination protein n=1 Tax=Fredinandcohnia sp. QZ13 TaxID=3073144 RepID=UPI0028536FCF|nr:spore germination protein [Fredinandcohnia sp. QZ13]MDR4889904.1 spore germination protein [Fredinandcohnia sp. QZ13]
MSFFKKYKKEPQQQQSNPSENSGSNEELISTQLEQNLTEVKSIFSKTPDLVVTNLVIKQTKAKASLVYLSELTDYTVVNDHVLKPLLFQVDVNNENPTPKVSLATIKEANTWSQITDGILQGKSVLFVDQSAVAFLLDTGKWPERSIEDTPIESSIYAEHIGFTESGSKNIALIRKHIQNQNLKIKEYIIGERGKTKVSILYLDDVANPELIKELDTRLIKIKVDSITNCVVLEEYIEDNPYSPFPQFLVTERTDLAASEILAGRMVMVVDGAPNVLVAPATFFSFFKSMDDYTSRWLVASFIRLLRYVGFFMAIFLPATYIAVIAFHFEVIPLKLLMSIGVSRERVPFPPFIEALIMEIALEMLREAGIRLPAKIGQTVGIVGGIVIGQAAVQAGIVSNIMVIVVALTAVASFIIPNYQMGASIRLIRFPMMILASLFGFVGLSVGLMILIIHLIELKSLGISYASPVSPLRFQDWKDLFIRFPQWSILKRPVSSMAIQLRRADSSRPKGDKK